MLANLIFLLFAISPFYSPIFGQHREWEPTNYPNPTARDWQRCNMRSRSLLCDPDAILSESERYRLNYELGQLEANTRQEHGRNFCERKGITAAVALARRVRGGNDEAVRAMANDMLRRWNIDAQCQKAIMVVMSAEDRTFWVARMPQVPVFGTEMSDLFRAEREHFRANRYAQGIQNVLRSIRDRALSKQQLAPDDGRSKGTPFKPSKPQRPEPTRGGSGGGFNMNWLLILAVIFFVIIPIFCCCCCLYYCCFRKKNEENPQRGGDHPESGGGGRRGGGRFGGLPLAGILGGIGGAVGNFFGKNRQRGGHGGGGGAAPPPPYYDPVPQHDDGKGKATDGSKSLYPSAPVKDEGGGGNW